MSAKPPNPNRTDYHAIRNMKRGFGLSVLIILIFLITHSWLSWQSEKIDQAQDLSSIAELSGNSLDSYFLHYEKALSVLAQELVVESSAINLVHAHKLLKQFVQANPDLLVSHIAKPDGQILVSSEVELGKPLPSLQKSPSFNLGRDALLNGATFDIGRPLYGPVVKEWIIPLRFGIKNSKGELKFMLVGVLPISRQQSFWHDLALPENTALGLIRDDAHLLSRYPIPDELDYAKVYGKPRTGILVEHLQQQKFPTRGVVEGFNSVAQGNYSFAFRRLSHYPLTLFVSTPMSNVKAKWWDHVRFTYLLMFLLLTGSYVIYRWTSMRQFTWELELERHEEKLHAIYEGSNDAIMLLTDAGYIDCNARTLAIFGMQSKDEFISHHPAEFSPDFQPDGKNSRNAASAHIQKAFEQGQRRFEWTHRRKNGEEFPTEVLFSAFNYGGDRILQATVRDISERKTAQAQIEFLAFHDALTQLPNRLLAKDHLELAIRSIDRDKGKVALLFLDLDSFKTVNDSLGHLIGDGLLKGVAKRLRECLRETDTLSRQGGDEFLIVLSDVRDNESVTRVAETILERLSEPFNIDTHELSTSFSIGIAVCPDDGKDFETLLKMADTAMYQAKEAGRNTYRFHTEEMNIAAIEHLRIRNGLHQALELGEFVLHFQPQISLTTGKVLGAEALIRWNHPELGMVPPSRFISIAEDSGLIIPIGDWVLQEACRRGVEWLEAGFPELLIAVNLSAVQCKRGDVEKSVTQALMASGFDPAFLELELTESLLIQDTEKVLNTMHRLKSMGVQLSIDDFGTGYSSLSYLKRFNVDKLKIDQSFVRDMADDPNDAAIVHAIIQMAKSLNLKTIAEGVENESQLSLLRLQHCDEAQGFHFARPMPAEEFLRYLSNSSR